MRLTEQQLSFEAGSSAMSSIYSALTNPIAILWIANLTRAMEEQISGYHGSERFHNTKALYELSQVVSLWRQRLAKTSSSLQDGFPHWMALLGLHQDFSLIYIQPVIFLGVIELTSLLLGTRSKTARPSHFFASGSADGMLRGAPQAVSNDTYLAYDPMLFSNFKTQHDATQPWLLTLLEEVCSWVGLLLVLLSNSLLEQWAQSSPLKRASTPSTGTIISKTKRHGYGTVPLNMHTTSSTPFDSLGKATGSSNTVEKAFPHPSYLSVGTGQEHWGGSFKDKKVSELDDEKIHTLLVSGALPMYALENTLNDNLRAIKLRRSMLPNSSDCQALPYERYDWQRVHGACCENVIGYMPIPVGVAGPLVVDGIKCYLPMATTEGTLVASTSRGCKAINSHGGASTVLTADGMTRAPVVTFDSLDRAAAAKAWMDSTDGQVILKTAFDGTSRFARLETISVTMIGSYLYIRFKARTGDAMGMNMVSKGAEYALAVVQDEFPDMRLISLSGNTCADKKASAMNWVSGRGKSAVAEALIPADVVQTTLKTDVDTLVRLNHSKNLIGSAASGSIGGFNAHAANIISAMFIATGQDPAQVVEGSSCITVMDKINDNLRISVSLPCIETGTVGGGTNLAPQAAMLSMLGVQGANKESPGENSARLARVIAAGVLAGELSLCAALSSGHLVKAHMKHNRSKVSG